jgi:hypothetical protein
MMPTDHATRKGTETHSEQALFIAETVINPLRIHRLWLVYVFVLHTRRGLPQAAALVWEGGL